MGDYFFGDYGANVIKRIDTATKAVTTFATNASLVIDIDIAADGSLYYLSRADEGRVYRVRSTTSAAPTIRVEPQDQAVATGQPATFTVEAAGAGLTYQWQRNGVNVAGATAASYTTAATDPSDDGDTFRVVISNSAGRVTSRAATLTVIDGEPPTATITAPPAGTLWTAGGPLSFAGTGTDPEDGNLPANAFTWRIDFHHDSHFHPFVDTYSGVKSDTADIPDVGEVDPDVFYRIHLTVRDSAGLTHSTSRDVFPQKVNLSLATEPAGLSLTLDGQPVGATPFTTPAVVGLKRTLGAPAFQEKNGVAYEFNGWSDGGAASHAVATPEADVTYTARYKVSTQPASVSLRAVADAYVRDGSFAAANHGASPQLQVKTGAAGYNRHAYLKFDLSSLGSVGSARLRVLGRLDNSLAASAAVTAYAGPDNWSESSLTWNNKPASGTSALGSFAVVGQTARSYEVDLTAYLKSKKAAGAAFATVVLKASASQATVLLDSDEAGSADARPALIVVAGSGGPTPGPTPTTLRPSADAHVRNGSFAADNFGATGLLEVKTSSAAGYAREAYLRFNLDALTSITSAKLRLNGRLTVAETVQTAVYAAADTTWGESAITWNNRPAASATALATATLSGTADKWYEWDLTAVLQSELAAGRTAVTLVLKNLQQTNAAFWAHSDEAAANGPELVVKP